jgi:hypothetical protein
MCRSLLTLYEWCQCNVVEVHVACTGVNGGSCTSVASETVRMHCYCWHHATKGWKSEAQFRKMQKKLEKKKGKKTLNINGFSRLRRRLSSFGQSEKSDVSA